MKKKNSSETEWKIDDDSNGNLNNAKDTYNCTRNIM